MKKYLFVLFFLTPLLTWSHNHCRNLLSGRILDAETKEPLPYSNIFIVELKIGAVAGPDGSFLFEDLCDGIFTLKISHVGCTPVKKTIELPLKEGVEIFMDHSSHLLEAVAVEGEKRTLGEGVGKTSINTEQLEKAAPLGLGQALEEQTGISTLSTGNNIKKPAIHGLTGNRIAIYNNGIKQESQQWGSEHAPELDINGAQKIEVFKGVSALQYGADAMGGVIKLTPPKGLDKKGVQANYRTNFRSNGQLFSNAFSSQFHTGGNLNLKGSISGSIKQGGNYRSPNRFLSNTGSEETNLQYLLSREFGNLETEIFYTSYTTELGIFDGAHIGNLTDLTRIIEAGQAPSKDEFSFKIGNPRQEVKHELTNAAVTYNFNSGSLSAAFGRQYNQRLEYDKHGRKGSSNQVFEPSTHLEITTHTAELNWKSKNSKIPWIAGIQGNVQKNTFEGSYFIPGYYRQQVGAFILGTKYLKSNLKIEFGARVDRSVLQAFNVRTLNNLDPVQSFMVPSYHLLLSKNWDQLSVSFQNGISWRPPAPNELYADGLHHGAARIEKGSASLNAERAINNAIEFTFNTTGISGSILTYFNYYPNYIYLLPQEKPALTIRGAFPQFNYQQTAAGHYGIDFDFTYQFSKNWTSNFKFATVRMKHLKSPGFLPQFPADNISVRLTYKVNGQFAGLKSLWVNGTHVGKQNALPQYDNENSFYAALLGSPKAYSLVDLGIDGAVKIRKKIDLKYFASVSNVFNTAYRDYTNAFRFYADNPGISFNIGCSINLNTNN